MKFQWVLNLLVTVICLNILYTKGQDYEIFEQDIWDSDQLDMLAEAQGAIQELCDNYRFTINNEQIDCWNIRLTSRSLLKNADHVISKREVVGDAEVEGSGTGDVEPSGIKEENNDGSVGNVQDVAPVPTNTESSSSEHPKVNDTVPVNDKSEISIPILRQPQQENTDIIEENSEKEDIPVSNDTAEEQESPKSPKEEDASETNPSISEGKESEPDHVLPHEHDENINNSSESTVKEEKDDNDVTAVPQIPVTNVTPINKELSEKQLPKDLAEVDEVVVKEKETINDQQSGNTVLLTNHQTSIVKGIEGSDTDKVLHGMANNAKVNLLEKEQPNTGESAKDVTQTSKSSTILIVLLVAVAAIAVAAVAVNRYKKRKNAASNQEVVKNGTSKEDIEKGTELKPLMKTKEDIITKEFTEPNQPTQSK